MRSARTLTLALTATLVFPGTMAAAATSTDSTADVPNRKTATVPESYRDNGITAHRGFSGAHPENTLESLQAGIDAGADWIETDVHSTKDGVLVVLHDTTTGRTAGIDRTVSESTWDELKDLDVNTEYRDTYGLTVEQVPPARMPLLSEVLDLAARQNTTRLQLQPKDEPSTEAAVRMIQERGMQAQVGFNDGDLAKMSLVKQLDPSIYVFWDTPAKGDLDEEIAIATDRGFDALVMNQARVTPETIKRVQQAGFDAGAWTVNDTETLRRFLDWGIDRIYTDHADRALLLAGHDERTGLGNQLLSYWPMNETNTFRQTPDKGSPNPLRAGRLIGDARLVKDGKQGKALRLDGRGDRVDVPIQVLPDKAPNFTASAWFRTQAGKQQTLMTTTGATTASIEVTLDGSRLTMAGVDAKTGRRSTSATGQVKGAKWHHVAVAVDGATTRLLIDGKTVATANSVDIDGTTGLRIGSDASGSGNFFQGDIDEVALWNRTLTDQEIQSLAQGATALRPRN